jgi:hypothetical protein
MGGCLDEGVVLCRAYHGRNAWQIAVARVWAPDMSVCVQQGKAPR